VPPWPDPNEHRRNPAAALARSAMVVGGRLKAGSGNLGRPVACSPSVALVRSYLGGPPSGRVV
jgi:hypothetical protein